MSQSKAKSRQNPTSPTAEIAREFEEVTGFLKAGKKEEAWRAAHALREKHPNDPSVNFVIGLMLAEHNKKADALSYIETAVKFASRNVDYLVALGKLYVQLGMVEFAPEVLHKAFSIDGTQYQAPYALANYNMAAGQGNQALPYYDLALRAAPSNVKLEIEMARADCLRTLGRGEETESVYQSALAMPQFRATVLTIIALLRKNDHSSEWAGEIRRELEKPGLTDEDRSKLLLCLGRLHENGGDFDGAFQNFEQSRKLLRLKFQPRQFLAHIDDVIEVLTAEVLEKHRNFGDPSNKPIFVVGLPRSGTTLTEQIISAHSQAGGVGELDRMSRMAGNFTRKGGIKQLLDKMAEVGPDLWKDVPRQYLNLVDVMAHKAPRTVDKYTHNFLHVGFIQLCFPNAKIIHCRRNPLDNFISAFQNSLNAAHSYSYDQVDYGDYYVNYLRVMEHWKTVLPDSIHELRYEALTANPELEVRRLLDFLDLPWEEGCLRFHERESTVRTLSLQQVRNPISTSSVARWRNYEKHLGPVMSVLGRAGVEF
jgi:tetratricopeptide (TPR) repeat protein